jgi:type I restriction enzyme, S subunit
MSELPDGWANACLADLGAWCGGGTPSKTRSEFWSGGSIPWVSPKDMKVHLIADADDHITEAAVAGSATNVVPAGSVLVVVRSGILRRTLPVAVTTSAVALNQDLKALKPAEGIDPRFLAWFLRGSEQSILHECAKDGTTVDSIDFPALLRRVVPVAPPAEQVRIVAAIEEQFSRLDAGVATLERARQNVKRMRVALLVKAFENLEAAFAPTSGRKLFSFVTSGSRGWAKYYSSEGPAFLRIGNVPRTGVDLDLAEVKRVSPPATVEGRRTRVQAGDLLISITADLGRVAVVPQTLGEAYINQHLALARPIEGLAPRYLAWYLASPFGLRQWDKLRRGATKIGLGLDDIRALEIPVPAPSVQQSTVNALEAAWGAVQQLERSLIDSQFRTHNLRASLLAAALSGQLVDQNPTDEPASVLLERIAANPESSNGDLPRPGRKPRVLEEEVKT